MISAVADWVLVVSPAPDPVPTTVIVEVPAAAAVTTPDPFTVATEVALEVHEYETVAPGAVVGTGVSTAVPPGLSVVLDGETESAVSAEAGVGGGVTVTMPPPPPQPGMTMPRSVRIDAAPAKRRRTLTRGLSE